MSTERGVQRSHNVPAAVGLGVDVLAVLLQVGLSAVVVLMPVLVDRTGTPLSQLAGLLAGVGVVALLLYLVGGALGLVGLLVSGRPRAMAGAAFGIGLSGAVLTLAGLALPPLLGALLG
jgi:hypothetical protein